MALPARFSRIWRSLVSSPASGVGIAGSMSADQGQALGAGAAVPAAARALEEARSRSNGAGSSVITPASIFAKSRTSLTIASSVRGAVVDRLEVVALSSSITGVSSMIVVMPMMPLSGVRNSWLMLARNWSLALPARSARSLACVSWALTVVSVPVISLNATAMAAASDVPRTGTRRDQSPRVISRAASTTSRSGRASAAAEDGGARHRQQERRKPDPDQPRVELVDELLGRRPVDRAGRARRSARRLERILPARIARRAELDPVAPRCRVPPPPRSSPRGAPDRGCCSTAGPPATILTSAPRDRRPALPRKRSSSR